MMFVMKPEDEAVLKEAREKFGANKQLSVAIEELNELSCVLTKFTRFDEESDAIESLKEKVTEEFADVLIVLDHVCNIFDLQAPEVLNAMGKKMTRLRRWLENGKTMQITTEDRSL